jgi:ankyrin repeat protein
VAFSPIHNAPTVEILNQLLDAKADVNIPGPSGFSPLMMALHMNRPDVASAMIEAKADVYHTASNGSSPFSVAVRDCPSLMGTLLAAGAPIPPADTYIGFGQSLLHFAVTKNLHTLVRKLIVHGADVTVPDSNGNTIVACAAKHGDAEMMTLALKHLRKAVSVTNNEGYSPLSLATGSNTVEIVRMLIKAKAGLKNRTLGGSTPLMKAASRGNTDMIKALIDANAIIDTISHRGRTALHVAILKDRPAAAEVLLASKANVDHVDCEGRSALGAAIDVGNAPIVKILVAAGANMDGIDQYKLLEVLAAEA